MPTHKFSKASAIGLVAFSAIAPFIDQGDEWQALTDNGPLYNSVATGGSTDAHVTTIISDTITGDDYQVVTFSTIGIIQK